MYYKTKYKFTDDNKIIPEQSKDVRAKIKYTHDQL